MKISIKSTHLELTPAINAYVEDKIGSLAKFVRDWDKEGVAEVHVEIARTTEHHHKGPIYRADADMRLPGKILRAEHEDWDIRVAIDQVKNKLQQEIKTYKGKLNTFKRGEE
ncbi:MAG: ribosome-associated translation inhibitor RaiA [Parcubacteria group bacterium]|nr:ribosome-associated translation inhibitor RaiA [Parcubacteria group bacterium]